MSNLSQKEQDIIIDACCQADDWGAGRTSYSKQAIEEAGYEWTGEHELFVFSWDEDNK